MSILSKFHQICSLLPVALLLSLVCACSSDNDDVLPQIATANQYINLNIVVSSGNENATRAGEDSTPKGGEDGDGREAGQERENEVTGITLILYELDEQNGKINLNTSLNTPIDFIKYYPVTLLSRETAGTTPSDTIEAVYTTGNQSLENSNLDLNKKYGVIVVANTNLEQTLEGKTVKYVCDYTTTKIYNGSGLGADASKFVMSLEEDYFMEFKGTPNINGETFYNFDNIRIERLAARVDFWAKGATYKENGYTTPGYEYDVIGSSGDKFVLTAVTPFNLYNNDNAAEYLIKRLGKIGEAEATDVTYLDKEPANYNDGKSLYVLDPNTINKGDADSPLYMHFTLDNIINDRSDVQQMPMSDFQASGLHASALSKYNEGDNIIVCYPKENTLPKDAPLYYYATGLRIEGDYYTSGWNAETTTPNPKVRHLIYYGYLRHQGEQNSSYTYPIYEADKLNKDEKSGFPMNFSVVRNNIYRISIDKITEKTDEKDPEITWQIKVKKWDEFKHDTIYM